MHTTFCIIAESVFDSVNAEKEKQEERERQKCQKAGVGMCITTTCVLLF